MSATAIEGRMSQTHFTSPDAEKYHRCPVCDKTLNPTGLAKKTTRYFLRMRNAPNREYVRILNEMANKQVNIKTANIATQRARAAPPQAQLAAELGDPPKLEPRKTSGRKIRAPRRRGGPQRNKRRRYRQRTLDLSKAASNQGTREKWHVRTQIARNSNQ